MTSLLCMLLLLADPEPEGAVPPAQAAPAPAAAPTPAAVVAETPVAPAAAARVRAPQQRWDHHGAVGLLLAVEGEHIDSNVGTVNPWLGSINVGATVSVGWASAELVFVARGTFGDLGEPLAVDGLALPIRQFESDHRLHALGLEVYGGYRGYFGDRFKTLYDLDAAVTFTPFVTAGPRLAIGAQYEMTSTLGVYATLGAQLGFGEVLQFRAEVTVGLQLRSYLLE